MVQRTLFRGADVYTPSGILMLQGNVIVGDRNPVPFTDANNQPLSMCDISYGEDTPVCGD